MYNMHTAMDSNCTAWQIFINSTPKQPPPKSRNRMLSAPRSPPFYPPALTPQGEPSSWLLCPGLLLPVFVLMCVGWKISHLHGCVVFHHVATSRFIDLFNCWWTFGYFELPSFFFFSLGCSAQHAGILVPGSGIKPVPPAVEAWSPNHRTTREFSQAAYF